MTNPSPYLCEFQRLHIVGSCVASAKLIGILTRLAYHMCTCPRTSLHEYQQHGVFRSKPLSVLVRTLHSLAVTDLG